MKIGVLDCHNSEYDKVANFTSPRKRDYCNRHGYDLIYHKFEHITRFPTWGKVLGVQKYLDDYDLICFLDTDVLIMNPNIKIEDQVDSDHNIFIGFMPDFHTGKKTHLSTSAWIIRNTSWSHIFLKTWWGTTEYLDTRYPKDNEYTLATRGYGGKYHEQSAFSYLYDTNKDCQRNTKLMPFSWFNHRESNYERGAFLVHFARQGDKVRRMKRFLCEQQLV